MHNDASSAKTNKLKFLMAFILVYAVCLLIVWDSASTKKSLLRIAITIFIAIVVNIVMFIVRKKYNSNKRFRNIVGLFLLFGYVVLGLIFQNIIFHVMFCMAMVLSIIVASFYLELEINNDGKNSDSIC